MGKLMNILKVFGFIIIIGGGIILGYLSYKYEKTGETIFGINSLFILVNIFIFAFMGGDTFSEKIQALFTFFIILIILSGIVFAISETFLIYFFILVSVALLILYWIGLFDIIRQKGEKYKIVSCEWCGNSVYVNENWCGGGIVCSNCSRLRSQGRI
jgi:hypothetical protein